MNPRTHFDWSRVQAALSDAATRRAILYILSHFVDAPPGTEEPGPEELLEAMESHPGADRRAVVDYFTYRPLG